MAKPILDQHIRVHNSRLPNNAMYVKRKEKTGCITEGVFFLSNIFIFHEILSYYTNLELQLHDTILVCIMGEESDSFPKFDIHEV